MDLKVFSRIITFLVFLAIGLLINVLVGNKVGNKVGNHKKADLLKKSITKECSEEICPVPKDWKGDKK